MEIVLGIYFGSNKAVLAICNLSLKGISFTMCKAIQIYWHQEMSSIKILNLLLNLSGRPQSLDIWKFE